MIFTADFSRWFQEKCMASPSGGSSAARDFELPLKCLPLKGNNMTLAVLHPSSSLFEVTGPAPQRVHTNHCHPFAILGSTPHAQ